MSETRDLDIFLSILDTYIRSGQSKRARKEIETRLTDSTSIPRNALTRLASLCRRAGIPLAGVRLLNPIVRPKPRDPSSPTADESAEYAACLAQIGGDGEALRLLRALNVETTPQALLFQAFSFFQRWDYRSSIPILERYVGHSKIEDYQRQVGELNLGAALVAEDEHSKAQSLLNPLLEKAKTQGNTLLQGNAMLLLAQSHLALKNWTSSENLLGEADHLAQSVASLDALYVRKWKAILALERSSRPEAEISHLNAVRYKARELGNWETLRDCDFHQGRILKNTDLLLRVFFGTSFARYRSRAEREIRGTLPEKYDWSFNVGTPGRHKIFDPTDERKFKSGQIPQRLLLALASDFYRPQRLASLHETLFPDRHYNPVSAPNVVHQAILRTKALLRETNYPLTIAESSGAYFLSATANLKIRVHLQNENAALGDPWIIRRRLLQAPEFSRAKAAQAWGTTERSANLYLKEGGLQGQILKLGAGPQTRYRWTE